MLTKNKINKNAYRNETIDPFTKCSTKKPMLLDLCKKKEDLNENKSPITNTCIAINEI